MELWHSDELLLPLVRFLAGKEGGLWVENIEAEDEELRLRSLQLLYIVMEKRHGEILKILFLDAFHIPPPHESMHYSSFCETFTLWIHSEVPQSPPSSPVRHSPTKKKPAMLDSSPQVATGETDSPEKDLSSTGGDGSEGSSDCGELLLLLMLKMKQLESNSFNENLLLTVTATQGVFSSICSFQGREAEDLQQFLMGKTQGSLGAVLISLARSLSYQRTEIPSYCQSISIARASHSPTKSSPSFLSLFSPSEKQLSPRKMRNVQLMEAIIVFEEFINELAGALLCREQWDSLWQQAEFVCTD